MEDDDDNLSFVSASDSDFDTEVLPKIPSVISGSLRQSSSTSSVTSLCSFRRTKQKRPAPQPPVKAPDIDDTQSIGTDHSENLTSMTSVAQQVNTGVENSSSESSVKQCKVADELVSHPIDIVLQETSTSPSLKNEQTQNEIKEKMSNDGFGKLQLRMIDDLMEPLSTDLPISTGIQSISPIHSYPNQTIVSYPVQSPIYSSPIYSSLVAQTQPSNQGPFYVASVHGQATNLSNFPGVPTPVLESTITGSQYVTVAPLAYVPQMSQQPLNPLNAHLPTSPAYGVPLLAQQQFNPLAHSISDPGIHRMVTSSLAVPHSPGPSLQRLSEGDEDDDAYEEVFVQDGSSDNKDLVPMHKQQRRRRLERSDSVTVAHLYEDIIISSRWNIKVTFTNLTMVVIGTALFLPNSATILYNFFRLVFGTLFPAYYSYKAVRTKNVKEYVKWMMYWIVFAFFTCAETITDVFLSFWFPFYYEIKILVVLWLLSPATRGSSILYRKFVHPWLTKKEEEIDECIAKAKQQGYSTVVQLGTKGVNYATSVIMQTAIKGGGGIVSQLKRSYSTSEIGEDTADHNSNVKAISHKVESPSEDDDVMFLSSGSIDCEPRHRSESESLSTRTRGHSTGRSIRTSKTKSADVSDVYFHEVPEPVVQRRSPRTHDAGRTTEGGGPTTTTTNTTRRSRSGDISYATLPRTTTKRAAAVKKRQT